MKLVRKFSGKQITTSKIFGVILKDQENTTKSVK